MLWLDIFQKWFPLFPASSNQKSSSSKAKYCRGPCTWKTDSLYVGGAGGLEGVLLSCGDLRKYSSSRCSPSQWKVLVHRSVLARFLCLSGCRLSSTVAGAQELLRVARTCLLLVSPPVVLSPHEYPEGADGEGVREASGVEEKTATISCSALARQERMAALCDVQTRAGDLLFLLTASWLHAAHASGSHPLKPYPLSHCMASASWARGSSTHGWTPWSSCSISILSTELYACILTTFFFPLWSVSLWCFGQKGFSMSCLLVVTVEWPPAMAVGFFSFFFKKKKLKKKKSNPCSVYCLVHYIISPMCFQCSCFTTLNWNWYWGAETGDANELVEESELKEPFRCLELLSLLGVSVPAKLLQLSVDISGGYIRLKSYDCQYPKPFNIALRTTPEIRSCYSLHTITLDFFQIETPKLHC